MWLRFQNNYKAGLWLVIGYYHPNCPDGGDWGKKGWWRLEPGDADIVMWTSNDYATFYAEADDGEVWQGGYVTDVPYEVFDWCWDTGSTNSESVGMRLITMTNAGWPWIGTLNLTG